MFKIGDKVRCINDNAVAYGLIKGRIYTVTGNNTIGCDKIPSVILEGIGDYLGFFETRFELVNKPFDISTATDQELADEYRNSVATSTELGNALRARGFEIRGVGGGRINNSNPKRTITKKVETEIVL